MSQLRALRADGAKTVSSIELVEIINSVRAEEGNRAKLRHDNFLTKVEKVLGDHAPNFRGMIEVEVGKGASRESPCYYLPPREAHLMVMSESYKVQAAVYDRMHALETHVQQSIASDHDWVRQLLERSQKSQELLIQNIAGLGDNVSGLRVEVKENTDSIKSLEDRVINLESMRPRKEIKGSVKELHRVVANGVCPCCRQSVHSFQFDHFFSNQHADFEHSWPLCEPCHGSLTRGVWARGDVRSDFDAYQAFAKRKLPEQKKFLF